jgi:hypothetical protein
MHTRIHLAAFSPLARSVAQRRAAHDPSELFMWTACDENEIDSVEDRCTVLTREEYIAQGDDARGDPNVFFCTRMYDPVGNVFENLTRENEARLGVSPTSTGPGAHGTDGDDAADSIGDSAEEGLDDDDDDDDDDGDHAASAKRHRAGRQKKQKKRRMSEATDASKRPSKRVREAARFKFTVPTVKSSLHHASANGQGAAAGAAISDPLDVARGKLHV